jgi:putative hemolysin
MGKRSDQKCRSYVSFVKSLLLLVQGTVRTSGFHRSFKKSSENCHVLRLAFTRVHSTTYNLMSREPDKHLFRLDGAMRLTPFRRLNEAIESWLERILGLHYLEILYERLAETTGSTEFLEKVLEAFSIRYDVGAEELSHIPPEGSAVVIANHPFGAIEGVIMAQLLGKLRPDIRIMANYHLQRIPQIKRLIISVDPFGGKNAVRRNTQPLREAIRWVKRGGLLMVFPAGEVSHICITKAGIVDPKWSNSIARIVKLTQAPVIPVYFHDSNSLMFQMLGLLHPRLRTAMIPRELINKTGSTIRVHIGQLIPFAKLNARESNKEITRYLRLCTYMLRDIHQDREVEKSDLRSVAMSMSLTQGPSPILLSAEVRALPQEQCLVKSGSMQVYYATTDQIYWLLREIGRLREITFRAVGEGTGKPIDIDLFDAYYLHLFLWNAETREVVGAYRMGLADQIVARFGKKGLYSQSLFKYKQQLLDTLNPAIELGRSFVRSEYQRSFTPLLLLWKGIGQFIARHSQYCTLFGPVTISSEYRTLSRQLLVDFLKINSFQSSLSCHVKPRRRFRGGTRPSWAGAELAGMKDIDELSQLVAQIEGNRKGIPILLKHYLKLGGRLLAFSVDVEFNKALDGLIVVDLRETDPKLLQRYMGLERRGTAFSCLPPE